MDTSLEYTSIRISMCDCPEIQEGHTWENGDWYAVVIRDEVKVFCWTDAEDKPSAMYRPEWLPRPEQLMLMLPSRSLRTFIHDLHMFTELAPGRQYEMCDLDILLIRLFMYEKHHKKWDWENEGWVPVRQLPTSESACAVCGDKGIGILCDPPCELYAEPGRTP